MNDSGKRVTLEAQQNTGGGPKIKKCPACNEEYQDVNLIVCPRDRTMLLTPQKDELIGQILNDRYKVVEEVGRGGMSAVYKGIHELMDRTVAIKVLLPQLVSDQISIKRFQQEAQAASHLQHPNVITVYDYGFVASGQPYLVMDFLEGESLSDIIRRNRQVPVKRMIPIFMQACEALEHAHQKGVIHRDLKSSNIMLIDFEGKKDFVKVVDFGIAKLMPSSGKQSQNLTQTGEVFGSPIYMSPEQCMAQSLDARSDIYSMGAMMYESLTGRPPLMGNSIIDTMQMHMSTPPKPFNEVHPDLDIPEALEQVVLKALAKKPEQRYQSMQELRDALEGVSKLIDKEKLFGPGPVTKGVRAARNSMAKYQPQQQSQAAQPQSTKGAIAPNPTTTYQTSRSKQATTAPAEKAKELEVTRTERRTTRTQPKKKPDEAAPDAAKSAPLDKIKQLEIFKKVPVVAIIIALVVVPLAGVGVVFLMQNFKIGNMFSTQQIVEGMVYYYKKATKSKQGDLYLWVSDPEEETPGKLVKLQVPSSYNLDEHSANTSGCNIGDYWKITYHQQGDKKIVDQGDWPEEQARGEDLRQINNLIKSMFSALTTSVIGAKTNEIDANAIAIYYMPEWTTDNFKKLDDTWLKEQLKYKLVQDANSAPKSYIKVESFDKDQGKASVLCRTKHWIEAGPQYVRIVLLKKDNRKWLIAKIEEISPTIWENDGLINESGGEEAEQQAEE